MISPESYFRKMPVGLPPNIKRLLNGLAWTSDCTELAFDRLRRTARELYEPGEPAEQRRARFTPTRRVALFADAWGCIDNLARLRAIVGQFPVGDPPPQELAPFMEATAGVKLMRNRGQHLDEDYASDAHFKDNNPVFGTLSWVDDRHPSGHVRTYFISGPMINPTGGVCVARTTMGKPRVEGDVSEFSLMAFDRELDIDAAFNAAMDFLAAFEETARRSITSEVRDLVSRQGIPLGQFAKLMRAQLCDMILSTTHEDAGEGKWTVREEGILGLTEVPHGGHSHHVAICDPSTRRARAFYEQGRRRKSWKRPSRDRA